MKSEVEGLPDLHTFVKINNYVSRFSFPHVSFPKIADSLVPRKIPESTLWLDPSLLIDDEPDDEANEEGAKPAASVWQTAPAVLMEDLTGDARRRPDEHVAVVSTDDEPKQLPLLVQAAIAPLADNIQNHL